MFQEFILLSVFPFFIFIREEYELPCTKQLSRQCSTKGNGPWRLNPPYDNERIWNVLKYPAGYVWDRRLRRQSIGIQDWLSCLKSARASREQRITRGHHVYKINNKKSGMQMSSLIIWLVFILFLILQLSVISQQAFLRLPFKLLVQSDGYFLNKAIFWNIKRKGLGLTDLSLNGSGRKD